MREILKLLHKKERSMRLTTQEEPGKPVTELGGRKVVKGRENQRNSPTKKSWVVDGGKTRDLGDSGSNENARIMSGTMF